MIRATGRGVLISLLAASTLFSSRPGAARPPDSRMASGISVSEAEEGRNQKRETVYKIINFAILVAGLAYLLRKPLAAFFAQRSASIRKGLEDGRRALEASEAQWRAVEEKLARLEEEIRAFKASALREIEAEGERLRQATAEEVQKTLQLAQGRIEAATRAAQLELRGFAVEEALRHAEALIHDQVDEAARRRLVDRFIAGLHSRG